MRQITYSNKKIGQQNPIYQCHMYHVLDLIAKIYDAKRLVTSLTMFLTKLYLLGPILLHNTFVLSRSLLWYGNLTKHL